MTTVATLTKIFDTLAFLERGFTLSRSLDGAQLSYTTYRKYVRDNPELQELFAEAETRGRDVLADTLLEIDSHPFYGSTNPQMAKVISDNIKWFLARKDPTRYGDKVTIENHYTADKAIIDALEAAKARAQTYHALPAPDATPVIDITPTRLEDLY